METTIPRAKTVIDLPDHTDMSTILLEIPEDCGQLDDNKLKEGYFVSMHANGHNLFVAKELTQTERGLFCLYPTKENPLRNWKVKSYQTKP